MQRPTTELTITVLKAEEAAAATAAGTLVYDVDTLLGRAPGAGPPRDCPNPAAMAKADGPRFPGCPRCPDPGALAQLNDPSRFPGCPRR